MNVISIVFVVAITLLAIFMIAGMSFAILGNFQRGREFRRALASRVRRLPLSRMLQRRGIDVDDYLHQESVVEIEKHLRLCENCEELRACDKALSAKAPGADLSFCPNDGAFNDIKDIKAVIPISPAGPGEGGVTPAT